MTAYTPELTDVLAWLERWNPQGMWQQPHEAARLLRSLNGINPEAVADMCGAFNKLWRLCDDSLEGFDSLAAEFDTDTGFMRPGKDVPSAMPMDEFEQKKAWQAWIAKQWKEAREQARAALDKAKLP